MANMAEQPGLQRQISLPMMVFFGLGNIIGAGVYVLIGEIVAVSGFLSPVSFLLASIIVAFTVFSYAELSARFPFSAGAAIYIDKGFNWLVLSRIVGLTIMAAGIISAAAILQGVAGYLAVYIELSHAAIIIVTCMVMTIIAVIGISQSVFVVSVFTLIEIAGLLIICWVSVPYVDNYLPGLRMQWQHVDLNMVAGTFSGALLAFYAYTGFEDMATVAEEVQQPESTMPKAAILTLLISTMLYTFVSIAVISVAPDLHLKAGNAPMSVVYQLATGSNPVMITAIGSFAVVNGAMIQLIMVSRVLYGMANRGWLPKPLAYIHSGRHTPVTAILVAIFLIAVFALTIKLVTLARIASYLILVVFVLVNISLWRIKRQDVIKPAYAYPMWLPVVATFLSIGFLLVQLV